MTQSTSSISLAEALQEKLTTRTAHVGVVGLGYVGLPLAVEFARAGFETTGVDLDPAKVAAINRGESYIRDVPASDVAQFTSSRRLRATARDRRYRQARHDQHLRADAAAQNQGSRICRTSSPPSRPSPSTSGRDSS